MEKFKIKIHPTFALFACVLIYFGKATLFLTYIFVIILHELAHAFVARLLGYKVKNIKLLPFGICLNMNSFNLDPKDEIKIAVAGPLLNFILGIITLSFWWILPESYNYTFFFGYANFITAIFNLLPCFPLDGGRVFLSFLKLYLRNNKATKFAKIVNVVVAFLLLVLFIYSCFYQINFTYLFVEFCVLSGLFEKDVNQKYTFITYSQKKKLGSFLKVRSFCVDENVKVYKVCRYFNNFSYLQVDVVDDNKKIVKSYSEGELVLLLESLPNSSLTFKQARNI